MIQVAASQRETSHISFIDRVGLGGGILSSVYIENAKARCDVVFMIRIHPPLETEDPFKSFL